MNYDNESWYRIIKVLNSKNYADIHVLNRAAIVDDLLNLARTGFIPYRTAFDGLQYLKQENNYLPFKAAFSGLTYLDQRFSGLDQYHKHLKVRQILTYTYTQYICTKVQIYYLVATKFFSIICYLS